MTPISGATRLVGVIGDPIGHSRSPAIFNAAFAAHGLDWRMLALPVARGDAPAAVTGIRALGIEGCSVTMPHKHAVVDHLDGLGDGARLLGAVNCIRRVGDRLIGENTDGDGFVRGLLADTGLAPEGRSCVVVGAGGAARAVAAALAQHGAAAVVVVNRSEAAAHEAASLAGPVGRVGVMADVEGADLVVQSTPVGMTEGDGSAIPAEHFGPGQVLVDLIYHPAQTPTMAAARAAGARVANGLSMLVHQAAIQFELWTSGPAPIEAMTAAATS